MNASEPDSAPSPAQNTGDAHLRIMAARVVAQQRWPYVSSLLFNLRLVPRPHEELPTMAVDSGWRLYYSEEFVLRQTPEALATVLLHEALHCVHAHAERFAVLHRTPGEHGLWNIAGDAGINEILNEAGMPWPDVSPVLMADLARYGATPEMTTEGVFFALVESDDPPDSGDCGSVVGGGARGYELPVADAEHPAIRSDQQSVIRDRVAHDVLTRSQTHGDVPGGIMRWAESVLEPQVSWRDALGGQIRRGLSMVAGRRDYVYTRPSRRQEAMRQAGSTAVLPAMRQPAPPRVCCIVDTSGSIGDQELRDFAAELIGIARASGVSSGVTIIPCDAEAYEAQRLVGRSGVEELALPGGGGTDMRAGFEAALQIRPRPHVLVVLTDGYTPWPDEQPRAIDSVIVVLSDPTMEAQVPEWATPIVLE